MKETKDLILNRYNSVQVDHLWCSHCTQLGRANTIVIIDIATRKVIGFATKISKNKKGQVIAYYTCSDVMEVMDDAMEHNHVPKFFHSNQGSIYVSSEFHNYLVKHNIRHIADKFI